MTTTALGSAISAAKTSFVGINHQDPLIPIRHRIEGRISLGGVVIELSPVDSCPGLPGDINGPVGAERIEYHDVVRPGHRFEAVRQVGFFIECQYYN